MGAREWSGSSEIYLDIVAEDGAFFLEHGRNDYEMSHDLVMALCRDVHGWTVERTSEIVVEFDYSGYYDPGRMYGRGGDPGYPPEGDDERIVTGAYMFLTRPRDSATQCKAYLSKATLELLTTQHPWIEDAIYGMEIDRDCGDDRDHEED